MIRPFLGLCIAVAAIGLSGCLEDQPSTEVSDSPARQSYIKNQARTLANIAVLAQNAVVTDSSWFTAQSSAHEVNLAALGITNADINNVKSAICPSTTSGKLLQLTWIASTDAHNDLSAHTVGAVGGGLASELRPILPAESIGTYKDGKITTLGGTKIDLSTNCAALKAPTNAPLIVFEIDNPAKPKQALYKPEFRSVSCGQNQVGTIVQKRNVTFLENGTIAYETWQTERQNCVDKTAIEIKELAQDAGPELVDPGMLVGSPNATADKTVAIGCPKPEAPYKELLAGFEATVVPTLWKGGVYLSRIDELEKLGQTGQLSDYSRKGNWQVGEMSNCLRQEIAEVTCETLWPEKASELVASSPFRFVRNNTLRVSSDLTKLDPNVSKDEWTLAQAGTCQWKQPDANCTKTETQDFVVQNGNSGDCTGGTLCSCHIPLGTPWLPNKVYADKLCEQKGFEKAESFETAKGPLNVTQCNPMGGCFVNKNEGNLVCRTLRCTRQTAAAPVASPPSTVSYVAGAFVFDKTPAATCPKVCNEIKNFKVIDGNSGDCAGSHCACHVGYAYKVPRQAAADGICISKGYTRALTFGTRDGVRGVRQCDFTGGWNRYCFMNASDWNLVCTNVNCIKEVPCP